MTRNLWTLMAIICLTTNVYCQKEKKNYISLHVSNGISDLSRGNSFGYTSERSYSGKNYLTIGFDYAKMTSENLEMCTGLSVTFNDMAFSSTSYWSESSQWGNYGGSTTYDYSDRFFIFSVPGHLKLHLLKYLFIDGGISINYHPSMGYTWGIGYGGGAGAEYTFKSGISLSLSPYMQWNMLNIGSSSGDAFNSDNLKQKGINVALGYRF